MRKSKWLSLGTVSLLLMTSIVIDGKDQQNIKNYKTQNINAFNNNSYRGEKAKLLVQVNLVVDKTTQSTVAQQNVIKDGKNLGSINVTDRLELLD